VHELVIVDLKQLQRFRIEIQRVALVIDGFDAREEFGIEEDRVFMRCELGRFLPLYPV
jgi:hypothetical protein